MNYLTITRWLAIGWTIIMLIGCLTPHEQVPGVLITFSDKLLHIAIFALFGLLWMEAGIRLNIVIVAGLILGGLIEALQYLLPINRSADWADLAADFAGTIVGVGVALIWSRLYPNHRF
jgi:VanZ family protein